MKVQGWPDAVDCRKCKSSEWVVVDGSWTCSACNTVMHFNPTDDPEVQVRIQKARLARAMGVS